jgi:hypothetical protein
VAASEYFRSLVVAAESEQDVQDILTAEIEDGQILWGDKEIEQVAMEDVEIRFENTLRKGVLTQSSHFLFP